MRAVVAAAALGCLTAHAGTVALWLFDEPAALYPSCPLADASPNGYILALGRGGCLVEGKYGRALEPCEPKPLVISEAGEQRILFGLAPAPIPAGRSVQPLWWGNAHFAALATAGENHLRKPAFANPIRTRLNLGTFDWTVEFWFRPGAACEAEGVVFELGRGPRGENDEITALIADCARGRFLLVNQPARLRLSIPSDAAALRPQAGWHHFAFTYSAAERRLRHYVDGVPQKSALEATVGALRFGEEAYFSVGRDGLWRRPLPGAIDELRFSDTVIYQAAFRPTTLARQRPKPRLLRGLPLLFGADASTTRAVPLGTRKHLFLDDALVAFAQGVRFVPNPPRWAELVIPDGVRGHLSVVEDEAGLIRLYYQGPGDSLAVMVSKDGIHWVKPDLGRGEYKGERNIVLQEAVGLGTVFLDPNAPPEERWKYFSGIRRQGMYVFFSPDGWSFQRNEVAALPFSAGSQSAIYYDDQRGLYAAHHRSDYAMTPGGETQRRFLLSETEDLMGPWPFTPVTAERMAEAARHWRFDKRLKPWYLDNGPLAPPGLSLELPTVMSSDEGMDPVGTDIYVTKALKYPWAPDAYLAFPSAYFHYRDDGPPTRRVLGERARGRGSGVVEVQLAVSRDGRNWKRYPRPAYAPIGGDGSNRIHMLFLAHGLVRRGNEIWQYVGGHGGNGIGYHSAWTQKGPWPLWRLVQRLDGFVAAEGEYTGGTLVTRPLTFQGNRLLLNVDTGAVGYVQVGFLDETGMPVAGYSVDDCVYINGDFLETEVEWLGKGFDLSQLAGKPVQLVFRLRGARLYAMQFVQR
jgi:hypothetical protein